MRHMVPAGLFTNRGRTWSARRLSVLGALLAVLASAPASGHEPLRIAQAVRDVTPPGVVRVYRGADNVTQPSKNRKELYDVGILPNGDLTDRAVIVHLPMVLPESRRMCYSALGARWVCGVWARSALINLVSARVVTCDTTEAGEITGRCFVDQTEVALWMIENGWAEPSTDQGHERYVQAFASAQQRKVGLWSEDIPPRPTLSRR